MKLIKNLFNNWVNSNNPRVTEADSVSDATRLVFSKLEKQGDKIPSRDGDSVELFPHTVRILQPYPFTVLPGRKNNPFATIAETLWVWAGRNDVGLLTKRWLPRAASYSDDWNSETEEGHWRAGYGPRLRNWSCRDGRLVDQLELVINRLKRSQGTRQAIMTISDPDADSIEGSKDYPCNRELHFLVRNGKLNMNVTVRSNDMVMGFCINSFEWMFIMDYVAAQLDVPLGVYNHNVASMHYYVRDNDKVQAVIKHPLPLLRLFTIDSGLKGVTPAELKDLCNEAFDKGRMEIISGLSPVKIHDYSVALYAENALKDSDADSYIQLITGIQDMNLKLSLLDIGQRRLKTPLYTHSRMPELFYQATADVVNYLHALYECNQIIAEEAKFSKE